MIKLLLYRETDKPTTAPNTMTPVDYSDYGKFGEKSTLKRHLWTSWLLFTLLSSLLGDSVILIASRKGILRAMSWTIRQVQIVCAGIWGLALYLPVTFLVLGKNDVSFDYRVYTCNYRFTAEPWRKWLKIASSVTLGFVPNILIVTATVMLVLHLQRARTASRQCRGLIRSHGIITVVLTAIIYTISILPFSIHQFVEPLLKVGKESKFHTFFYRLASSCLLLNLLTNFFICTLTVRSFRTFLVDSGNRLTDLYRPCSISGKAMVFSKIIIKWYEK
ncbi:hypothetical protein ACHWQZ_G019263 [Mnemiopsis leidyi]